MFLWSFYRYPWPTMLRWFDHFLLVLIWCLEILSKLWMLGISFSHFFPFNFFSFFSFLGSVGNMEKKLQAEVGDHSWAYDTHIYMHRIYIYICIFLGGGGGGERDYVCESLQRNWPITRLYFFFQLLGYFKIFVHDNKKNCLYDKKLFKLKQILKYFNVKKINLLKCPIHYTLVLIHILVWIISIKKFIKFWLMLS